MEHNKVDNRLQRSKYAPFHEVEDGEEYEYSYDASGFVVGCWVKQDKKAADDDDDCGVEEERYGELKSNNKVNLNKYAPFHEIEDGEEYEYSYDASGYVVACWLKQDKKADAKIESSVADDDDDDDDDDAKSESSVKFVPNYYCPFDDKSGREYVIIADSDEQVEQLQHKDASFDDGDSLEYHEYLLEKFDASGQFVGHRVNKGCESEDEVESDANCNESESESGDHVELSRTFTWLSDGGEEETEEIQEEAVSDNFDMMLGDQQVLRPNLKRKAEVADIGQGQIVSCLMAPPDCPWLDSRGQLRKRAKSLNHSQN